MLTQAFDARLDWMHQYARTSPAFRDSDFRAIVEGLADADGVDLLGFSFTSKDNELSTQWGFSYLGRYYAYMSGKNPQIRRIQPWATASGDGDRSLQESRHRYPRADGARERLQAAPGAIAPGSCTYVAMPFTVEGYMLLNILGRQAHSRDAKRFAPASACGAQTPPQSTACLSARLRKPRISSRLHGPARLRVSNRTRRRAGSDAQA